MMDIVLILLIQSPLSVFIALQGFQGKTLKKLQEENQQLRYRKRYKISASRLSLLRDITAYMAKDVMQSDEREATRGGAGLGVEDPLQRKDLSKRTTPSRCATSSITASTSLSRSAWPSTRTA